MGQFANFVEEDATGDRDIERFDRGGHGDGDGVIGHGEVRGINAKSFVAEQESDRGCCV